MIRNDLYHNDRLNPKFRGPGVDEEQFIPSLVPGNLLDMPIEITCEVGIWELKQQVIVKTEEPCMPPQPGMFECNE